MKYQLGDFVRFVDEKREGYITRILSDNMVGVTGDDDFEIPVMVNNLTHVHGHSSSKNQENEPIETTASVDNFVEKGVFLAAIPDANKGSVVHFYLLNESSFQLMVTMKTKLKDVYKGEFADSLGAQKAVKVLSLSLADLDIWPTFDFQVLFYTKINKAPVLPLSVPLKFRAKDFSGSKKPVSLLKEQGWLFRLDEPEMVLDAQKIKESFFKPAEEKRELEQPAKEVDLHIEKLRDDHDFLNSKEILEIQLSCFNKNLEAALVHNYESIIFIHGVGNRTLQHEIHSVVSKHPQVKTFMDAQKEKFGYGATKVILK